MAGRQVLSPTTLHVKTRQIKAKTLLRTHVHILCFSHQWFVSSPAKTRLLFQDVFEVVRVNDPDIREGDADDRNDENCEHGHDVDNDENDAAVRLLLPRLLLLLCLLCCSLYDYHQDAGTRRPILSRQVFLRALALLLVKEMKLSGNF